MKYHKAQFWTFEDQAIHCHLCPNKCILKESDIGPCRTRINIHNSLYTRAYNNPSAIHIDPIEKKPLYHFKPFHATYSIATNGCVLHCMQCQNHLISQCSPTQSPNKTYNAKNLINQCINNGCESISLTYTDPIAYYEYSLSIANEAKKLNLPIVFISSGYINPEPLKNITPFLSAANIDLKTFNPKTYIQKFKGQLAPIKETIQYLHKSDSWLEITYLLIPGINDKTEEIRNMCSWLMKNNMENVPLHFSKFYPAYRLSHIQPTPNAVLHNAKRIANEMGIKYCYLGNLHSKNEETTYCHVCGKLLIDRWNRISNIKANKCPKCHTIIPGIW